MNAWVRGPLTLFSRGAVMANAARMATTLSRGNAVLGSVRVRGDPLAAAAIPCDLLRALSQRGITMRPTLVPSVEQGLLGKALITSNEIDVVSGLKKVEHELDNIASSVLKVERDIEATVEDRSKAVKKRAEIRENAAGRQDVAQEIAEFQSTINYLEKKEQSLRDEKKSLRDKEKSIREEHREPMAGTSEENTTLLEEIKKLQEAIKYKEWSREGCVQSLFMRRTCAYSFLVYAGVSQSWGILTQSS